MHDWNRVPQGALDPAFWRIRAAALKTLRDVDANAQRLRDTLAQLVAELLRILHARS